MNDSIFHLRDDGSAYLDRSFNAVVFFSETDLATFKDRLDSAKDFFIDDPEGFQLALATISSLLEGLRAIIRDEITVPGLSAKIQIALDWINGFCSLCSDKCDNIGANAKLEIYDDYTRRFSEERSAFEKIAQFVESL